MSLLGVRVENALRAHGLCSDAHFAFAVKWGRVRIVRANRGGFWIEFGPNDRQYVLKSYAPLLEHACKELELPISGEGVPGSQLAENIL